MKYDNLINILLNKKSELLEEDIINIIIESKEIFKNQNSCLELDAPINVIGDIHGQFNDLLEIFEYIGDPSFENYLFLGDYVDRGKNSIETICLLLLYKIKYSNRFFMLRGNHECITINKIYGFYDECKRKYSIQLWKKFCDLFCYFPITAIIENKILSMHGGLSPLLSNLNQLKEIIIPTEIPNNGIICDLLWSDPCNENEGWSENDRGVSFNFGKNITNYFVNNNKLELILRAHQVVEDGYEFFHNKNGLTLFSAKNYCNEFDNNAGILIIDQNLKCKIKIIKNNNIL